MPINDTFVSLLNFGFDNTGSQYDIRVDTQFGSRHLQGLIPERRSEMVYLLRLYADQIESGWLSKEGGAPQENKEKSETADNKQSTPCDHDYHTYEVHECIHCGHNYSD